MSYASRAGRARVSATNPQAQAVCDRCGLWTNRVLLTWQWDWRGAALQNIRLLVCATCRDEPQSQLRAIVLSADPVPIMQPRVEPFTSDEGGNSPVIGAPQGLDANAVMPFDGATQTAYGAGIGVLSITGNGTVTVSVTTDAAHGLSTGSQIAVEGLSNPLASGFYSVTVTSATAFTYQTADAIAAGSLLTATTRLITVLVGLPYGVTTIPQV